ncbi:hypothetical protein [Mesorhizobium sp. CN2-181]|uniref:hypothetical protein n=1 Tax=Mesorhizobium yinganensis TaxID=3157707 RepID=UPI0032B70206
MPERFEAGVQYNDWKGTVAADEADNKSIQSFFRERCGLGKDSYVVGIRMHEHTSSRGMWVRAIVADGEGFDDVNTQITAEGTLRFKEFDLELSYDEFFKLFKRFSLVLTTPSLKLDGREYEITNPSF